MKKNEDASFNRLGEFQNKEREKSFTQGHLASNKTLTSILLIVIGFSFALMILFDLFVTDNKSVLVPNLIIRLSTFACCIFSVIFINKSSNSKHITLSVSVTTGLIIAAYIGVQFVKVDTSYSSLFLPAMMLIIAFSLLPSRWIYILGFNILTVVLVGGLAPLYLKDTPLIDNNVGGLIEGIVFMVMVAVIGSYFSLVLSRKNRIQYLKELQLEISSTTDSLTKIYNRFKFDILLDYYVSKGACGNGEFSLIMYDIDDFKSFNDKYGHIVGDKILISISNIVSKNIRKSDFFARWGGEEFIILLPGTSLTDAQNIAEKLRSIIETDDACVDLRLTVSFGVSSFSKDDTVDTLIRKTDSALYKAKKNGKNRVEVVK